MINFGHETEELEFKKSTGETHNAVKDIVAILNKHEKGILYFGVAPNGDVTGLQVVESTLRDVSRVVSESIQPQIYPQIQKVTIDGRDIIEVRFGGKNKPYSAYGKYYIRVADESRELTPAELKEMMIAGEYSERWEQFETSRTIGDVDESALKDFYCRATACGRLPDDGYDPERLLDKLGLSKNGRLNNAGRVLFGNDGPVTLKTAVFATDEKLTFLDINRTEDNIFRLADTALSYIKRNIRWRAEIAGSREEIPEIPLGALREIVINGFAHAEYGTVSQHEIDIHPGKVSIYSPGAFPSGFSPEDFATKNLSSIIRNELIAKVLYLCHDIEYSGGGFKRVYALCAAERVGCSCEKTPLGFSFIFSRKTPDVPKDVSGLGQDAPVGLSGTERAVYRLLKIRQDRTREELSGEISRTVKTVQRALDGLKAKGLIARVGNTRTGRWEIL